MLPLLLPARAARQSDLEQHTARQGPLPTFGSSNRFGWALRIPGGVDSARSPPALLCWPPAPAFNAGAIARRLGQPCRMPQHLASFLRQRFLDPAQGNRGGISRQVNETLLAQRRFPGCISHINRCRAWPPSSSESKTPTASGAAGHCGLRAAAGRAATSRAGMRPSLSRMKRTGRDADRPSE